MGLTDEVRATCAEIAAGARHVRIDEAALAAAYPELEGAREPPALDPVRHHLAGPDEEVAQFLLVLDSVNFGSGWFPTLRKRRDAGGRPVSGYNTVAWALADRWRAGGCWDAAALRSLDAVTVAHTLGQDAGHELMSLYAEALRDLGAFLAGRTALEVARAAPSAERLAEELADGMPFFADRGFYKRAQITASDLALAGLAGFGDLDRLTVFADNLVPHVLRVDGVLRYDGALAARIDAGELIPAGSREEREIRGCAVHACERLARRLGIPPRVLDIRLWNRGQEPRYKARPRHRTRTVFY